uniref:Cl23743_1b n=1 Tax=Arundo donax TaxID=35708 RepID=A0A0A9DL32_ARUDO
MKVPSTGASTPYNGSCQADRPHGVLGLSRAANRWQIVPASLRSDLFSRSACIQRNPYLQIGLMGEQISKCDVLFHQSILSLTEQNFPREETQLLISFVI